jgi:hypothetical protein
MLAHGDQPPEPFAKGVKGIYLKLKLERRSADGDKPPSEFGLHDTGIRISD